jgi:hypothetical protein
MIIIPNLERTMTKEKADVPRPIDWAEGKKLLKDGSIFISDLDGNARGSVPWMGIFKGKYSTDMFIVSRFYSGRAEVNDGDWTITRDVHPSKKAYVIFPDLERGTPITVDKLKFGDIVSVDSESFDSRAVVILNVGTSTPVVHFWNLEEGSKRKTLDFSELEDLELKLIGFTDRITCYEHNYSGKRCYEPAITYLDRGNCYCAKHTREVNGEHKLVHCTRCGVNYYKNVVAPRRRGGRSHPVDEDGEPMVTLDASRSSYSWDDDMCESCNHILAEEYTVIHGHSYRPPFMFITHEKRKVPKEERAKQLFLGVELEVEYQPRPSREAARSRNYDRGSAVLETLRKEKDGVAVKVVKNFRKHQGKKWLYLKRDGSLLNGFEMVSHPATLTRHVDGLPWQKLLPFLKQNGVESNDTDSCGLHIHAGKSFFPKEEDQIKLAYFIASHKTKCEALARRKNCNYAKFKRVDEVPWDSLHRNYDDRYEALNWGNKHTVEFRMFRGTLHIEELLAALEFVQGSIEFSKDATVKDLKSPRKAWNQFMEFANARNLGNLIEVHNRFSRGAPVYQQSTEEANESLDLRARMRHMENLASRPQDAVMVDELSEAPPEMYGVGIPEPGSVIQSTNERWEELRRQMEPRGSTITLPNAPAEGARFFSMNAPLQPPEWLSQTEWSPDTFEIEDEDE